MREVGLVLLMSLVMGALAATAMVPWLLWVEAGQRLMLGAAVLGIPLEMIYFGMLALALGSDGKRPKGWYWRSFEHHRLLSRSQRWWVMPWFVGGAIAFSAIALGIGVTLLGFMAAVRQNF